MQNARVVFRWNLSVFLVKQKLESPPIQIG
ncbi:MAG: hypothetical protein ACD_2C00228G0001, partial [uncultured bacterium (gcode 4)]